MAATLRDVSEKLNLSPGLVSRVLNNRPGVRATPETIARIRQLAGELNYEPSAAAKSLRMGKTRVVAFINLLYKSASVGDNNAAAGRLSEALHAIDYSLLVKTFSSADDIDPSLKAICRQRACDLVCLWGDENAVVPYGEVLERLHMPFTLKGRYEALYPSWHQVDYDHEAMMASCVRHLVSLGHRRIAYIGFDTGLVYQRRLLQGYRETMLDVFGLPVPDAWIGCAQVGTETSERQMEAWLAMPDAERPTAVVVGASTNPIWGMEKALARRGLRFGLSSEGFSVAGHIRSGDPMLFGKGYGFANVDNEDLASVQAERQIKPLLEEGRCDQRVIRISPGLNPLDSLGLLI